jgi:hypothetical protein
MWHDATADFGGVVPWGEGKAAQKAHGMIMLPARVVETGPWGTVIVRLSRNGTQVEVVREQLRLDTK